MQTWFSNQRDKHKRANEQKIKVENNVAVIQPNTVHNGDGKTKVSHISNSKKLWSLMERQSTVRYQYLHIP